MPVDYHAALDARDAARPRSRQTELARAAGQWGIGPSDFGACRRQIQYRERPPADLVRTPEDHRAAYLGTMIHDGYLGAVEDLGLPYVRTSWRIPIPGLDRGGELDLMDLREHLLDDLKSCGRYKWALLRDRPEGIHDDYVQAMIYAYALRRIGELVRAVRVVYIDRQTGNDYYAPPRPYDEQLALDGLAWLGAVADALDAGVDLPRDGEHPDRGLCKGCPFRVTCWQIDAAQAAGRDPYGMTVYPDRSDIEGALEEYATTTDPAVRTAIKAALRGIEPGQYGGYEYVVRRAKRPDPIPDVAARARALEQELTNAIAEGRPPRPLELMPRPMLTPDRGAPTVTIRPVHPATEQARQKAAR